MTIKPEYNPKNQQIRQKTKDFARVAFVKIHPSHIQADYFTPETQILDQKTAEEALFVRFLVRHPALPRLQAGDDIPTYDLVYDFCPEKHVQKVILTDNDPQKPAVFPLLDRTEFHKNCQI